MEQQQDTRNRYQKLYDERYRQYIEPQPQERRTLENTPKLSIAEAQEFIRRHGRNDIEHMEKLLIRNGYSYKHPRTHERIIGHWKGTREETENYKARQPCIPHNQQTNRTRGRKFKSVQTLRNWASGKLKIDDKRVKSTTRIGKKTGQFKTVWYANHARRK